MIINQMTDLIGNTPLLKIPSHVTGLKNIELYAKLEMMNPFGSVKDRTAWAMIKDDLGRLKREGQTVFENSSGNTAKSLQAIASIHGLKFHLVSALSKVEEQKEVLQIMGAGIEEIVGASDCFDTSDPNDPQYIIERRMAAEPDHIYFPSQFTNRKNPDFHEKTTGQEILNDLEHVDYFFGGLGTTGSSLGIGTKLREANPDCRVIGIAAAANHFIPGIRNLGQMMESTLFQQDYYNQVYSLTEQDALSGMMALIRQCAVLCGPSSGANFTAALRYLKDIDAEQVAPQKAVFVVCDRMEWYVSYIRERMPELFGGQVKDNSLSSFDSSDMLIVPSIAAGQIERWKRDHPDRMIIDIRTAQSFDLIRIPGSINMPQEEFAKWIGGANPFEEDISVLLICAVGEQSRHYTAYLSSRGIKAYNLEGGIMAWHDMKEEALQEFAG